MMKGKVGVIKPPRHLSVCTKAPQLLYIVSHLMNNAVLYLHVHGLHEGGCGTIHYYKMYRWRSTYLAAANNYKQYTAYSTELNGARGVRATSCSRQ